MELVNDAKETGSVSQAESSSNSEVTQETHLTKTQSGEKPEVTKVSDNGTPFHEHPRFKELVEEKNKTKMEAEMLRKEVENLKHRYAGDAETSQRQSVFDNAINDLVDQGMDRTAAARFIKQQTDLMQAVAAQNMTPVLQNQQQLTLSVAMEQFKKEKPDYDQYKSRMSEILSSLSEQDKNWVLSNITGGLKFLYNEAKESSIKDIEKSSFEKGRSEAYDKKREKASVSSSVSSSAHSDSGSDDFDKALDGLSPSDYAKKKSEFDKKEAAMIGVLYRG